MNRTSLTLASLLFVAVTVAAPQKATVSALLKTPAKFDKKVVTVKGKVDRFVARSNKEGKDYVLFQLVDKTEKVSIYGQIKLAKNPKNGDTVEVTGQYFKEKLVGKRTYKNEIDISVATDPKFGVKIVPAKA